MNPIDGLIETEKLKNFYKNAPDNETLIKEFNQHSSLNFEQFLEIFGQGIKIKKKKYKNFDLTID